MPKLDQDSGLEEYLAYAALNNPGLEAAFNRWRAALERIPQVEALPDPRFTYRYYIREVETRVGAMRQGVGLMQTFPWLGKLALRGDAAAAAAEAERARYEAAKLKLFHEVTEAYAELYYLHRSLSVVEDNARLIERLERVIRTRYRATAASHPDLIRAQVELGKLQDRRTSLRELRGPLAARLNAALNRPADAELPWPVSLPQRAMAATDAELLARLEASSPQLRALDAQVEQAERQVELAKKEYYPDVTLGAEFVDINEPVAGMSPSDAGKDAVAVTASLNLPIWWDKLSAGVREAKHRRLAAAMEREQTRSDLAARLKMAAFRYRDAERKLTLYRDTLVPKTQQALSAAEAAFRGGEASFTDLIDAQRLLLEFSLSAERAATDRVQRLAEIEMLTGRDLPSAGEGEEVQP